MEIELVVTVVVVMVSHFSLANFHHATVKRVAPLLMKTNRQIAASSDHNPVDAHTLQFTVKRPL
jgi:hypothetical protein